MNPRYLVAAPLLALGLAVATSATAKEVLLRADRVQDQTKGRPKLFVLAIGVAGFVDPFWPPLKWSERDAEQMAEALGLDGDRQRVVQVFTGKQASLAQIQGALAGIARKARRQDAIAVYISTHGTLALGSSGDLEQFLVLPSTASTEVASTSLSLKKLRHWLDAALASRKLLILAACHTGLGKSRLTPEVQEVLSSHKGGTPNLDEVSEGVLVFSAAARGETAREDDKLKGDVYTHYFLQALRSFDRNQDGAVSAIEAHDYAKDRAYAHTGGKQRATLEAQTIGEADILLAGKLRRSPLPVLEARGDELAGLEVRVDGGTKGRLPTSVALNPSYSKVELYRTNAKSPLASYEVYAPRGARIPLEELVAGDPWIAALGSSVTGVLHDRKARRLLPGRIGENRISLGFRLTPRYRIAAELSESHSAALQLGEIYHGSLSWSAAALLGEYSYSNTVGAELGTGLSLFRQSAQLVLADESDTLTYSATHQGIAPHIYAGWTSKTNLGVRLSLRYLNGKLDFGDPGSIDLSRSQIMLDAVFRFGGLARRL